MEYQTVQEPAHMASGAGNDDYVPRVLAWSGRIGRVRYLAYSSAAVIAILLVAGLSGGLLGVVGLGNTALLGLVQGVVGIAMLVASFVIARRRFNDMGRSGWWGVLLAVPFVNVIATLWLVFGKGDSGPNAFGPPPVPNTRGVIIVAWIVPVLLFGAVVAGAMSGYQAGGDDYRVRPSSGSQTF